MSRRRVGPGAALGAALLSGCITAPALQPTASETEARAATYAAVLTSRLALQRNDEAGALARMTMPGVPDNDPAVVALRLDRALTAVDFPAAVSAAKAQAELGPPSPIAALVLAADALNRNRARQAIAYLDLVPPDDHPGRLAKVMRAWALAGLNRYDEALALTEGGRAVEATGLLTTRALLLDRAGQTDAALAAYARLPAGFGADEVQARATTLRGAQGARSAAPLSLRHGLALSLDMARYSGPMILDTERPGLAYWPSTLVLGVDPGLGSPRIQLAVEQEHRRQLQAALAQLVQVPERSPWFVQAQMRISGILLHQGDPAGALAAADLAHRFGQTTPDFRTQIYNLRTQALLALSEPDRAIAIATEGLALETFAPNRSLLLLQRGRGRMVSAVPDRDLAAADLRAARASTTWDMRPRAWLIVLLAGTPQDAPEARTLLEGFDFRGLHDAEVLVEVGRASVQLGEIPTAVRALERAARIAPNNPEVLETLGDAYLRANRSTDARRLWQQAQGQAGLPAEAASRLARKLDQSQAARGSQ